MNPFQILREYYTAQTDYVRGRLAMECLYRLSDDSAVESDSRMLELLTPRTQLRDLGTVLSVRALFDFSFLTLGDEEHWERAIDWQLDLVDSAKASPEMRNRLHEVLPSLPQRKAECLQAARNWETVRGQISDERLLEWDNTELSKP